MHNILRVTMPMFIMAFIELTCCSFAHSGITILPSSDLLIQTDDSAVLLLLLANDTNEPVSGPLSLSFDAGKVTPIPESVTLKPRDWHIEKLEISLFPNMARGSLRCEYCGTSVSIQVCRGIDLTRFPWKRTFTPTSLGTGLSALDSIEPDAWTDIHLPAIWERTDNAWCKVDIKFPSALRGQKFKLILGAVDDNDITYFNGQMIGQTNGWDVRREYAIPPDLINWDGDNSLVIMVMNVSAGGGLTKSPFMIVPDTVDIDFTKKAAIPISRPKPGRIGNPLPFRRIHIDNGVLRYPEGDEVALWGVNYYPQSWYQFDNMKKLGVDMKETICHDLDDMNRMGVEIIRIHVFDREIADGDGNIIPNIHLDLLDYLIAEASKRGIYMFFTPIAWWSGPNEIPGSFSQVTSKPGMMFVPKAKAAAANYLRQFLNRKNSYTGYSYKDEPNLCFLEVMNEPAYFVYGDLQGSVYTPQGESPDIIARDKETLSIIWKDWLAKYGLDDQAAFFSIFRYELMRTYIKEMIGAIRSTDAKQPIAINYGLNGDDLIQAIADSECDAITFSAYPGGLINHVDGKNLLPMMKQMGKNGTVNLPYYSYALDGRVDDKARAAYEFDADCTNTSSYMYPAIAAAFRSGGLQIACQFQYDSIATAKWNTDWNSHWLNWMYTPAKTVSFMLAGEAFKRFPREIEYEDPIDELIIPPMATSFKYNRSILAAEDEVMYSRSANEWQPMQFPAHPKRIVGTGSSPYVSYGGSGIYTLLAIDSNTIELSINPDVIQLGDCMNGSFATPVAELQSNIHWFQLKMPGWENARCEHVTESGKSSVASQNGGWLVTPGRYLIHR